MRVFEYAKLKVIYIVCAVIAVVGYIPVMLFTGSGYDLGFLIMATPVFLIAFYFAVLSVALNWKKQLIGIIAPIPVISSMIESFVGVWYAIKGLICLLKKQDLVIGNADDNT